MALAIIRFLGKENGKMRFACDIGSNTFFSLSIGERSEVSTRGGLSRITNEVAKNHLREVPAQMLGRFRLAIPLSSLPEGKEYIQLVSFKRRDGYGVAWSEILKIDNRKRWKPNQKITMT